MVSDIEQLFKNAGVALDTVLLTEGVAELKRQYPLISDSDYQQLIAFDPTYKGGNELGKYGRWILDLYNLFVKDRMSEEKHEKGKAYAAEHPEAKMPPAPVKKSHDKIEDFQKLPDLLTDLEAHLKDIKQPIHSFKSIADLATAVRSAVEKDFSVGEKAQQNYKVFREAMADGLKVVYQDKDWIIGVPETYKSSSHFKKPVTNWCTAYPDFYDEYKSEYGGKYYIHLNKHTGELYQLHIESEQFMDVNDYEVDAASFIQKYPSLKNFYSGFEEDIKYHPSFWSLCDYQPSDKNEERELLNINPTYFSYIKNPSEDTQKYAVYLNGYNIKYIDNPTDEMKKIALKYDTGCIKYIKKPTEEMKRFSVQKDGHNIVYIKNPSEELKRFAIEKNGCDIRYIENPSEELQILAINPNASYIKYIKNPTEKVQLEAVKKSPYWIGYIKNPTEKVQLEAIKQLKKAFSLIKNPTEKAKQLQKELWGDE